MSSIFVGNIAWRTSEQDIGDAFSRFGAVRSVKIVQDRETGRSKGFGFVEFESSDCVQEACRQMDGADMGGRPLRVNPANQRN